MNACIKNHLSTMTISSIYVTSDEKIFIEFKAISPYSPEYISLSFVEFKKISEHLSNLNILEEILK
jgi:hypothetical protein